MMFEEKIAKLNSQQDRKKSYSVPEIQKILKVERHTVYKLIKEGHFKAAFIGGKWRISRLSFDLWLDAKEEKYGFYYYDNKKILRCISLY